MAKLLGNSANLPSFGSRQIVVCRDDDPSDAPATIALDAAIARARNQGLNVIEATPWPEPRGDKSDFNDVIREHGADAVRARILAALRSAALAAERLTPAEPPFPLPTATPADVYAATLNAVRAFFELSGSPRIIAPGMTGSGKTQNVGKLLPHVIAAAKAERELSGRENAYRAVYMVPAHRLGRQIAQRFTALCEEHGLRVAILEGRGDPWKPEKPSRPYLCRNLEAVGLALQAHQDVRSAVCGSAKGKRRCAFFNECGYLSQFAAAREADVLIVAHTFLFDRLPKSVLHDVAYVIVDEDFTPTGDAIGELPLDVLRPASINAAPALQRDSDEADKEKTEELHRYAAKLVAIFDGAPDGYLADEALDQFPPSDARFLRYLNWKRRRDVGMHPGMSLMERREAFRAAAVNQVLPKIAALTHMLDRGEAARIRLDTDDKGRRKLILHGRRHVANWVSSKPVLMLNATARLPDYQRFFGDAALLPLPQARLEHQHVHQVLGSFGKSAMTDKKLAGLLMEARAHIAAGKSLLVICHEQNEAAFQAIGARTLHHGDLAGDDDHGDVDVIMHIGGPFPDYRKIAELATARSGVSVPIAQPVRRPCFALMEDASGVQFERMAYEHPAAQAVHEGIYDAAFVQGGLGRGRGINRSAATPLEIWIYGNVPLPVPLASLRRWEPVRERALLAAGATHSNGRDLHRFTKEFPSVEAAERWRQRNPFDETRIRQLLADDPRAFVKVTWQPAGQGHKVRVSVCAAAEAPAFRRLAEAEFGRVLQWMVERFTEGKGAKKDEADIVPMNIHGEMSDSLMDPVLAGRSEGANSGHFREHPPDG
jgi:putative DNA primase/helicase